MNTEPMTVRGKVAVELGTVAVLTAIFLLLFPRRNPMMDVALAGFALLCIGATARLYEESHLGCITSTTRRKPVETVCKGDTVGHCAGGSRVFSRGRNPGLPEWRSACRG